MPSEAERQVEEWLGQQGFPQYAGLFAENAIDFGLLPTLSEADLRSIGIPLGHARKLATAAATLVDQVTSKIPVVSQSAVEAERRQLTVMFCDLVGSTELSSRLDPEDLRDIIRRYQKACGDVVARYEGFVAQYLGDGIMVYFGYPQAHEDAAERAVRTGLDIIAAVRELSLPAAAKLQVRIGAATGLAVVGDLIGRGSSEQAAVTGQTPNLAARVQALAEPGCLTIAESTRKLVGDLFEYRELGLHRLKGIDGEVRVLEVTGARQNAARFESIRTMRGDCVGRSRELDFLRYKWRRAVTGQGQVVLAWGEAGIGKSRLLRLLNERLHGESLIRVHVQCSPQHGASPLYPVIHSNLRVLGFRPEDGIEQKLNKIEGFLELGDQVECAPLLAALMSVPGEGRYAPLNLSAQEQKEKTLNMCVDFVANMATRQPVLYQVEDAHWIDPTTEEMLGRLIARLTDRRVLLIVTGRPEYRPDWLGLPQVSPLDLGRLGETEIRQMVRDLAGGKDMPEEVLTQILTKTDGVPLFVEELTRNLLESGLLRENGTAWVLAGSLPETAIPSTLRDSLMARLDRLGSAKEVVQVAATIGRSFSYALLALVLDYPEAMLRAALDRLFVAGLIFPRGHAPAAEYWFKHALIQDTAYESLLKSRRTALHMRILRALETHFPDWVESQPQVLMHHALRADLAEKAIHYGWKAGREALVRSANREALQLLGQAIALVHALPDGKERIETELDLQLAMGQAALAQYGYSAPETAEIFAQAEVLAQRVDHPQQYYSILYGLWATNVINGRLSQGGDLARRFLERASQSEDHAYQCIGHRMVGVVAFYRGQLQTANEHLERAIAFYDADRHGGLALHFGTDIGVTAHIFLAWNDAVRGRSQSARQHAETALALATRLGHALSQGQALHICAFVPIIVGDFSAALVASEQVAAFTEEHQLGYFHFWARNFRACAEAKLHASGALLSRRTEIETQQAFKNSVAVWYFHCWVAEWLLSQGRVEEAAQEVKRAIALIDTSDERWGQAEVERLRGECLAAMGVWEEAEHWLRRAMVSAQGIGALMFELRAALSLYRLLQRQGGQAEGQAILTVILERFESTADLAEIREARRVVAQ
ncbi:MAG: Adenylate cyclase [Proteobacteria bacterium]|nr:Adenylate cyclase [Pseudomonadota bacterium]